MNSLLTHTMGHSAVIKYDDRYVPASDLPGIFPKEVKGGVEEIPVFPCSEQHPSQEPKGGGNPSAHGWVHREVKGGLCV